MTELPPDDVPQPAAAPPPVASPPLPVLYLDEHFVAVSKPSGLLVHRDEHHPDAPAALQTVRDQLGKHLYPFHRLDRATSGILLFGFSRKVAAALQKSLAAPDAKKLYLALMRYPGSARELPAAWSVDRPLHDEKDVARECRTDFTVVEDLDRCAVVECRLFTGRYHQIRRHANHCGRHVIGDTTHGKGRINEWFRQNHGLDRLFLHLHRVSLRHPVSDEMMDLHDALPMELQRVLDSLRAAPRDPCPPSPS
ncbi:MAG: pseudouridine synthase [Planctomycetes bacterium]|nr:pseudouridine synthase [Planctomycetota bacterium]MCC7398048.1 pseudouridine synthase [Planctomycetota bacterium]